MEAYKTILVELFENYFDRLPMGASNFPDREAVECLERIQHIRDWASRQSGTLQLQNGEVTTFGRRFRRTTIEEGYGRLLFFIASHPNVKNIVELGTSLGGSTAFLAGAFTRRDDSFVDTIDLHQPSVNFAQALCERLGLRGVRFHVGKFNEILPIVLNSITSADLVFVDGDHRKESALSYFRLLRTFCLPGSVIIFDDINWSEEMMVAWDLIRLKPGIRVAITTERMGFVVVGEEQECPRQLSVGF